MHDAPVALVTKTSIIGHVSRDSTAIDARKKPVVKPAEPQKAIRKRSGQRKGEAVLKEEKRLDRQLHIDLPVMISDLPTQCDRG